MPYRFSPFRPWYLMKFTRPEFDETDRSILDLLQEDCKQPLAAIGAKVGLSAPAVVERIHKLEEAGVITAYTARLDPRKLGVDVTAFIAVSCELTGANGRLEREIASIEDVLECHHVTGSHSLMLKVKTQSTESLEELIGRIRALAGVTRTETMVVLSTHAERTRLSLERSGEFGERPVRRSGGQRARRSAK